MPPQEQLHKEDLSYVICLEDMICFFLMRTCFMTDCSVTGNLIVVTLKQLSGMGSCRTLFSLMVRVFAANARWDKYERSIRHDYITEKQDHQRSGEMLLLVTPACMPPEEDCSRGHARQIAKTRFFHATPVQHLVEVTDELWAREALNCGSSLPRSDGCHKCFAVAVDYFSKRVEAGPLMFKDATAVAWFFNKLRCHVRAMWTQMSRGWSL